MFICQCSQSFWHCSGVIRPITHLQQKCHLTGNSHIDIKNTRSSTALQPCPHVKRHSTHWWKQWIHQLQPLWCYVSCICHSHSLWTELSYVLLHQLVDHGKSIHIMYDSSVWCSVQKQQRSNDTWMHMCITVLFPACMILCPMYPYVANATKPSKNEVNTCNNY